MQIETPVAAPTPAPPAVPSSASNSLAEMRAYMAGTPIPAETPPAVVVAAPPVVHTAVEEPVEPPDEGEPEPQPVAEAKPPEQTPTHRWKDPDSGVTLDLRRRDHRRIKRLLEERAEFARQAQARPEPRPEPEQRPEPQALRPDPGDPEPTLEQFAEQADPYGAYVAAQARWHARQEFQTHEATRARAEQSRHQTEQVLTAQARYDAKVPEARTRYADFDAAQQDVLETLSRIDPRKTRSLIARLLQSDIAHDLTYHLGTHPEALDRLFRVRSRDEHLVAIGDLEASVRAELKSRASTPPHTPARPPAAPIAPVGGSASVAALPDGKDITSLSQFRALKPKLGMTA